VILDYLKSDVDSTEDCDGHKQYKPSIMCILLVFCVFWIVPVLWCVWRDWSIDTVRQRKTAISDPIFEVRWCRN